MTKQEAIQEQIDDIMDSFDFSRVVKMMQATNWTWAGVAGIPEERDLRRGARERLHDAVKHGESVSGGFRAWKDEGEDAFGPWVRVSLQWGPAWDVNDGTPYTK